MDIKDGGPAFPHDESGSYGIGFQDSHPGISVRDYFAAAALTGLHASVAPDEGNVNFKDFADIAYGQADAMLAAREVK